MKQRFCSVALVAMFIGVFLTLSPTASALRCYSCESSEGWSDCNSTAIVTTCDTVSQDPQTRQLEPTCLNLAAEALVDGTKRYGYLSQCFFDDKSLYQIQSELPSDYKVLTYNLCTTDLCNGPSSSGQRCAIAFSSLIMVAVAILV